MKTQSLKALWRERFLSSQHTNMMLAVTSGTQGTVIASYVVLPMAVVVVEGKAKPRRTADLMAANRSSSEIIAVPFPWLQNPSAVYIYLCCFSYSRYS